MYETYCFLYHWFILGTIHLRPGQILMIFDPSPLPLSVFYYYVFVVKFDPLKMLTSFEIWFRNGWSHICVYIRIQTHRGFDPMIVGVSELRLQSGWCIHCIPCKFLLVCSILVEQKLIFSSFIFLLDEYYIPQILGRPFICLHLIMLRIFALLYKTIVFGRNDVFIKTFRKNVKSN